MRNDIRIQYHRALDDSHNGHPVIIQTIPSGQRGRPRTWIDPDFLRWAYTLWSTAAIARFLGVSRSTIRNMLLAHGIVQPQSLPQAFSTSVPNMSESLQLNQPSDITGELMDSPPQTGALVPDNANITNGQPEDSQQPISFTGPVSNLSDEELDTLLRSLRSRYQRSGLSALDGMIRALGLRISRERVRQSLLRIDPVERVFERITIRRRVYSVPGPNSLWHHDGQHGIIYLYLCSRISTYNSLIGLIRWGIVIHGFIDGYSRLITGLRASDNNRSETVLDVFLEAADKYRVPSRLQGDHGVENLLVAAWMEREHGEGRGSYIWGRYVISLLLL